MIIWTLGKKKSWHNEYTQQSGVFYPEFYFAAPYEIAYFWDFFHPVLEFQNALCECCNWDPKQDP